MKQNKYFATIVKHSKNNKRLLNAKGLGHKNYHVLPIVICPANPAHLSPSMKAIWNTTHSIDKTKTKSKLEC
jgi:hypothetical protein